MATLEQATLAEIDALWIGRDLGYRGGRRTGLALTDDVHVDAHMRRWNLKAARATAGTPIAERTAAIIWDVLNRIAAPVFLWNVFPLHPHQPGEPFTNRSHNSLERNIGQHVLRELIELIRPRRLIAIGNDAAEVVNKLGYKRKLNAVRHPSYGGQTLFIRQVSDLYNIR